MKNKILIIISVALLFSACQQRQRAELHALYLANQALEKQIKVLNGQQWTFLKNHRMMIRTSLDRKVKRAEHNLWHHLITETALQLTEIERLKTLCLKNVGGNESTFPVLFVEKGQTKLDIQPWQANITRIKTYGDSLFRAHAPILKTSPNQGIFSDYPKSGYELPWTLVYSTLNQWKLALIKAIQKVIVVQDSRLILSAYQASLLGVCLEAIPESQAVVEGQTYAANMFVSNIEKGSPFARMQVNGVAVSAYQGQGIVQFRPRKTGRQEWTGTITFKKRGRDTTFSFKKEFWVLPH